MQDLSWIDEPYSTPLTVKPKVQCPKCGVLRQSLHRDHIMPKWRGGADSSCNIQLLCANCHEDKTREDERHPDWHTFRGIHRTPHSEEAKAKIRKSKIGKPWTSEARANILAGRARSKALRKEAA